MEPPVLRRVLSSASDVGVCVRRTERGARWLVLLHGIQSNQALFDELFAHPAFADLSLLSLDLVGFGRSERPETFSYDLLDQSNVVSLVLEQERIGSFSIIGHSLGAMIGTLLLKTASDRVERLVSLEGNLAEPDCGASLAVAGMSFDVFREQYDALRAGIRADGPSGARRAEWLASVPDYVFHRTSRSIVAWARSGELYEVFVSSPRPKLLLIGGAGKFHSRPAGPTVLSRIVPGAGHFMLLERPAETLREIRDFLE